MTRARALGSLGGMLVFACTAVLLALTSGTDGWSPQRTWQALADGRSSLYADVVLGLRLPRAWTAFACGGLLAVAGALMQVLLRNPLADPYVLGLAGGAGVGALSAMAFGMGSVWVLGAAWTGALTSVAMVLWFGRESFIGRTSGAAADEPLRLLLIGVALATGWAALITLILALAPDASLRGLLFWLMGDLDGAVDFVVPLTGLLVVVMLCVFLARDLNVLTHGAQTAHALGVSVKRTRVLVMLLASSATALAVTTIETVGFVGLIVPNALRLVFGNDQRFLLPASALAGGGLLTLADTLGRTVVAPMQLPVGAVMAVLGAPAFMWILGRGSSGR
jgi:iron complex transport system permease protein